MSLKTPESMRKKSPMPHGHYPRKDGFTLKYPQQKEEEEEERKEKEEEEKLKVSLRFLEKSLNLILYPIIFIYWRHKSLCGFLSKSIPLILCKLPY